MRAILIAATALALTNCGPAGEPQDTGPAMPEGVDPTRLEITCAVFAAMTPADLAERFGAENIATQMLAGPEGESFEATVVYANDPTRRLEVIWNDAGTIANLGANTFNSTWTGPGGLRIGMGLPEVERANGRAFKLWGFDWDYGGWVSDWMGGTLAPQDGCLTRVRLDATAPNGAASGDSEFMSDSEGVRRAAPRVGEIGLAFSTP